MKVTAFHLANKVEEAAKSYFSNSFMFSSRTIDVERTADFRNGVASVQFFVHQDDGERIPMGVMEFDTVQERDNKVAFQCRYHILPSEESREFFLMMSADSEQYVHYSNLAEMLRKRWEMNIGAYLPAGSDGAPAVMMEETPVGVDDEYDSLSPEEIEAITGVRPEPKGAAAKPAPSAEEAASEDDIQRIMGMMMGPEAPKQESDDAPLTLEEIEALAKEVQGQGTEDEVQPSGESVEEIKTPEEEKSADEMSAEDIWKQISGT